jgi:hypothetical protein
LRGSISHIPLELDNLTNAQLRHRLRRAGHCYRRNNDDWFPPEPITEAARQRYEEQARSVCAPCPVADACLLLALRYEARNAVKPHGIWGGFAPWERESMLRSLSRRSGGIDVARTVLGVAS